MLFNLQLFIREKMNAEFSIASSLTMFIQFFSNFIVFILCSQRLFDIFAELSLRIFFRNFQGLLCSSQLFSSCIIMTDTFKNRSRELKSFFLNLFAAEFHHTELVFIPEHITDRGILYPLLFCQKEGGYPQSLAVYPVAYIKHFNSSPVEHL